MPEYSVPFRLTLQGVLVIDAPSADAAKSIAESGLWDDQGFKDTAEHVDWGVTGPVRRVEEPGS